MPTNLQVTRRQNAFLRSLLQDAPGPDLWPSPAVLRRWLRRPAFLRALDSLRLTLNYTSDILLAYASTSAALSLQQDPLSHHSDPKWHKACLDLLRLSHLRQRFPATKPPTLPPKPADPTEQAVHQRFLALLNLVHPSVSAREALEFLENRADPSHPTARSLNLEDSLKQLQPNTHPTNPQQHPQFTT